LPKETKEKKDGKDAKKAPKTASSSGTSVALASAPTNSSPSANARTTSTNAATGTLASAGSPGTNSASAQVRTNETRKPGEPPKPIEVVFLNDSGKAKMAKILRGISDDAYMEITEGLEENQEVVSGGYKAINRELEDGKKIKIGPAKGDQDKEKKEK
jgi:hypothetical protein